MADERLAHGDVEAPLEGLLAAATEVDAEWVLTRWAWFGGGQGERKLRCGQGSATSTRSDSSRSPFCPRSAGEPADRKSVV